MRQPSYLLIGAGEQTKAVLDDILRFHAPDRVVVADIDYDRANDLVEWSDRAFPDHACVMEAVRLDAFDHAACLKMMRGARGGFRPDVAINCAGNAMNPTVTAAAIEARCHYVDIGHDEAVIAKQFAMHDAAKAARVRIVPTCGIAPGAQAMIVMHAMELLDPLDTSGASIKVRCGGIPQVPKGPLGYRWAFATSGLLKEYLQPTNVLRGGISTFATSMTGDEPQDVSGVGKLEASFTGGNTGTMVASLQDMGYRGDFDYMTLRYPGHWQKMRDFQELGLFDSKEFVTLLERHLLQYKDDPDLLVLRVIAEDARRVVTCDLVDRFDPATGLSAMQRCTGFSAAIMARMLHDGGVQDTGVLRQEASIPHNVFLKEWAKRGLHLRIAVRDKKGHRRPTVCKVSGKKVP